MRGRIQNCSRHSGEDQGANVVIAALAVLFLSEAVAWESSRDLLALSAVIAPLAFR